jgi:hypothetical protein
MRPSASDWFGEFLFALLMAASPIVGSFWVHPDVTRIVVLGVGVAMVLATLVVGLRPVKKDPA